jgi:hypothetical protein
MRVDEIMSGKTNSGNVFSRDENDFDSKIVGTNHNRWIPNKRVSIEPLSEIRRDFKEKLSSRITTVRKRLSKGKM